MQKKDRNCALNNITFTKIWSVTYDQTGLPHFSRFNNYIRAFEKFKNEWVQRELRLPFSCSESKGLKWARLTLKSSRTKGQTFERPRRHRCSATTHILLAVERKETVAWRQGRCPQMELSHCFSFTDGPSHTYFTRPCPIAASSAWACLPVWHVYCLTKTGVSSLTLPFLARL